MRSLVINSLYTFTAESAGEKKIKNRSTSDEVIMGKTEVSCFFDSVANRYRYGNEKKVNDFCYEVSK